VRLQPAGAPHPWNHLQGQGQDTAPARGHLAPDCDSFREINIHTDTTNDALMFVGLNLERPTNKTFTSKYHKNKLLRMLKPSISIHLVRLLL
jgi:hypothetical protein